ncbi:predicted protein, partial [Nematostella vectensis]
MAVQLPLQMDPLFLSLSLYRRRKHEDCVEVCTQMLKKNPYDQKKSWVVEVLLFLLKAIKILQNGSFYLMNSGESNVFYCFTPSSRRPKAAWCLKTRALTEQVYVDEVDVDEEGIAEMLMDDNSVAQLPRPGTSLKKPGTGQGGPTPGVRYWFCETRNSGWSPRDYGTGNTNTKN